MRAEHYVNAAVKIASQRQLFRGGLGVNVHYGEVIVAALLLQDALDSVKGVSQRLHEDLSLNVDDENANRWANFWSVSAAWRLAGEAFLQDSKWANDLKLRVSYGTNGNLPGGYYTNLATWQLIHSVVVMVTKVPSIGDRPVTTSWVGKNQPTSISV